MRQTYQIQMTVILLCLSLNLFGQSNRSYLTPAHNPIIWADVPDMSIIRVGVIYYMSSTTMHMSPGIPIMKSYDLINWKLVNYAYDTLATTIIMPISMLNPTNNHQR
jgi:beta-xylosidase